VIRSVKYGRFINITEICDSLSEAEKGAVSYLFGHPVDIYHRILFEAEFDEDEIREKKEQMPTIESNDRADMRQKSRSTEDESLAERLGLQSDVRFLG
jgi:hypothetical protein